MTIGLTVVGISAGILVFLVTLFRIESNRGSRIFITRVRAFLDVVVIWSAGKLSKISIHIGTGVFRSTFHFIIQKMLGVVISLLTRAENRILKLQLRNKQMAKIARNEEDKNHLDAIATYKEENSLSDEEKRKRRMH